MGQKEHTLLPLLGLLLWFSVLAVPSGRVGSRTVHVLGDKMNQTLEDKMNCTWPPWGHMLGVDLGSGSARPARCGSRAGELSDGYEGAVSQQDLLDKESRTTVTQIDGRAESN